MEDGKIKDQNGQSGSASAELAKATWESENKEIQYSAIRPAARREVWEGPPCQWQWNQPKGAQLGKRPNGETMSQCNCTTGPERYAE